jgi:hypothetical protein
MKLKHHLTIYSVLLITGCTTGPKPSTPASLTDRPPGDIQWVCAYQVPPGWVILDMITNYGQCGGGQHNLWQIENLNGMSVGSQVTCCTDSSNPAGWVTTSNSTNYGKCGGNATNNMKTIRKLSRKHH